MIQNSSPAPPTAGDLEEQLKTLEAQVAQFQAQARQADDLFRLSPTAALLLDQAGRVTKINERGIELLGATPGTLLGRRFMLLLLPASQGTLATMLERARRTGLRQSSDVQVPAQGILDVLLEVTPLPESHQAQFYLTLTDFTAFKKAQHGLLEASQHQEKRLQEVKLRMRELTGEFEQVIRLSEQQLKVHLARADHSLSCYQQELQPQFLEEVRICLLRTHNLLDSLDQYLRERFIRTRVRRVNLEQVWQQVLREARKEWGERDVEITSMPLPTVQGDTQVFRIMLGEYLKNAVKYTRTREQTRLRLLVEDSKNEYWIGLQDNGVGFNMRQKDRAFELFGRLHPEELYEGTGLGLTVVRRLCERFGARAWGEGKVEEGATFWFSWPKGTLAVPES